MPPDADDGTGSPSRGEGFRLALRGESALRPRMEHIARDIMAAVEAGGPGMIPEPAGPGRPPVASPPARDDPAAMAWLRAIFVDSHDGWVDDLLAVARPPVRCPWRNPARGVQPAPVGSR